MNTLRLDGLELAPAELVVLNDSDPQTWRRGLTYAAFVQRNCLWWLGDAVVRGELRFGENFWNIAMVDAQPVSIDALDRWAGVARRVAPQQRSRKLSWSHHQAVCRLSPANQRLLLAQAELDGLSSGELARLAQAVLNGGGAVNAVRDLDKGDDSASDSSRVG